MYKAIPDKLYHGSNVKFDKFDIDFIGSGSGITGANIGIYTTTSLTEALSYGKYIYVIDFPKLNLKKQLFNFRRSLNKDDIQFLLSNGLEDFGEYDYNDFMCKSDTEIIGNFVNDNISPQIIFEALNQLGYNYTKDQYDNNLHKNSDHYILYFEPAIEEKLTFKNQNSLMQYINTYIKPKLK